MWAVFACVVAALLALDLGARGGKERAIGVRESLRLSAFYILISCAFGAFVWWQLGWARAVEYFTGYLVEKTLSMDNLFVMSLVFGFFGIPRGHQSRVLLWGILGVVVLRGLMIGLGIAAVERFGWVMYLFAGFLVYTGIKMLLVKEEDEINLADNVVLALLRRTFRITSELHGKRFFVRLPGPEKSAGLLWWMTPLFAALVTVEFADAIFALDSVPAIFGITTDPYIVYTSNIFAILGLRALYFSLAAVVHRFTYLHYSLALVLLFIGGKVFATGWLGMGKIPAWVSLGVTVALIAGGILFSLYKTGRKKT